MYRCAAADQYGVTGRNNRQRVAIGVELSVQVIALARLQIEHHRVQRGAPGPTRRRTAHHDLVFARIELDR